MAAQIQSQQAQMAENGDLQGLIGVLKSGITIEAQISLIVAQRGHMFILRWLKKIKHTFHLGCFNYAISNGQLEVIKWLHAHGGQWNDKSFDLAVARGQIEIVKWLHENGCPWTNTSLSIAVARGHLNIVKLLCENGCPWDSSITEFTVSFGHLDVFTWAVMTGKVVSLAKCLILAEKFGQTQIQTFINSFY